MPTTPDQPSPAPSAPEEAEKKAEQLLAAAAAADGDEYTHAADKASSLLGRRVGSRRIAKGIAELPVEEVDTAARIGGEEAVQLDEDRVAIEREAADIEAKSPGTPMAAEAGQIKAQVEQDAADAIEAGIGLSQLAVDADGAMKKDRWFRRRRRADRKLTTEQNPTLVEARTDEDNAQELLARASHDLADADKARKKLEDDMKAANLPVADTSTPPPTSN